MKSKSLNLLSSFQPAKLNMRYSNSEGMSYSDYEILIQDRVGGTRSDSNTSLPMADLNPTPYYQYEGGNKS